MSLVRIWRLSGSVGEGLEVVALVEGSGVLVDGVDEQDADAEFVGRGECAEHGVA